MKILKIFLIPLLVAQVLSVCYASDLFSKANNLYKKKDFTGALKVYDRIESKGWSTWYNMANCYYHDKRYMDAFVCWNRSLIGAPPSEHESILYNIDMAKQKIGIKESEKQKKEITHFDLFALDYIPLIVVQLLFILVWFLFFFLTKKNNNSRKYKTLMVIFLLSNLVLGITLLLKYHISQQRKGIVMKSQVCLYAGPDKEFHLLGTLDQAAPVVISEQRHRWCKVQYKDKVGWVLADFVAVL